jgi:hypothetical protein
LVFTQGSPSSVLTSMHFRHGAILMEAPEVTIKDSDFVYTSMVFLDHESPTLYGDATVAGSVLRNNTFINASLVDDTKVERLTLVGNTFVNADFHTTTVSTSVEETVFDDNDFRCEAGNSAITVMHSIGSTFRKNRFENCSTGIGLGSAGGAGVGHNLIEYNAFRGVNLPVSIGGKRNSNNRVSRNVMTGNADEPQRLAGLTIPDWGSELKPNHGKGRPRITSISLSGPATDQKVVLSGKTFTTFGNDTVDIYVAESYWWGNPHTDKVVVRPKIYLTSVTSIGSVWTATLDAGSFGLEAGNTLFTIATTDEQGNTSEFSYPMAIEITGS